MVRGTRIGFVLLSSLAHPVPSTRVSVGNMLPFLEREGFEVRRVFEPATPGERPDVAGVFERVVAEGCELVYFQKVHGPSVLALVAALRGRGIRTVFGVCDLVDAEMAAATDATVVVTDYLKSLYPAELQHKISVVHDGIERPEVHKTDVSRHRGSALRPLNAVLVTSSAPTALPALERLPAWLRLTIVGRYPPGSERLARFKQTYWQYAGLQGGAARRRYLAFMAHPRIRRIAWNPEGVYEALSAADIGIIPVEAGADADPRAGWRVKSENRLSLKMAVGLPVIATPIPAYEALVGEGGSAILARSGRDWAEQLERLRDPQLRERMGREARAHALAGYSMEQQAEKLIAVFRKLLGRP